jgi:hypothetical protein
MSATLLDQALALYRHTQDPLLLSAIQILSTPDHPHYDEATRLIESMADAHLVLYGKHVVYSANGDD